MNADQQAPPLAPVGEYVHNYRHDLASQQLECSRRSGRDTIRSGPAGSSSRYDDRFHGPTLRIEFDNNCSPARLDRQINHFHSGLDDPPNEYGADLLREHHQ